MGVHQVRTGPRTRELNCPKQSVPHTWLSAALMACNSRFFPATLHCRSVSFSDLSSSAASPPHAWPACPLPSPCGGLPPKGALDVAFGRQNDWYRFLRHLRAVHMSRCTGPAASSATAGTPAIATPTLEAVTATATPVLTAAQSPAGAPAAPVSATLGEVAWVPAGERRGEGKEAPFHGYFLQMILARLASV